MRLIEPPVVDAGAPQRRVPLWAWLTIGFVLLALARVISGADELNSAGTLSEAIKAMTPVMLAALAGLWSERAGVVNIGLEGMMILGTLGAGYFGFHHGPWAGVLGAIVFGAIGGILHAVATVIFAVDQIVSGVAITIIAGGAAAFLSEVWFTDAPGGGQSQSPHIRAPQAISIDPIADWASRVQGHHWFLVSDVASVIGALTRDLSTLVLLAVVLVVGSAWVLWRTPFGLRLRSCGESPAAAETLGVPVRRYKFVAVVVSGAIAGLGGGFIALILDGLFLTDQTHGRGYVGLASMIFGNWRPGGLVTGAGLFGYTDALQQRAGGEAVRALLIILAVVLLALAFVQFRRGGRVAASVAAVLAVAFAAWFFASDTVPDDFTKMTPYVATLLVLVLSAQRLRMPAADGLPYRKGQTE